MPVGFVKETYQGHDYLGYTCAACHTGQVNYQGKAIRIDGGPAMADMPGFLHAMESAMQETLDNDTKKERFVNAVKDLNNDYRSRNKIIADLEEWTQITRLYNTVNHSHIKYWLCTSGCFRSYLQSCITTHH